MILNGKTRLLSFRDERVSHNLDKSGKILLIYQQFSSIIVIVNIVFIFGKEETCMAYCKKKTGCVQIAYKYRAYPDVNQQVLFQKTFGCCRKVYNLMLADKIEYYH